MLTLPNGYNAVSLVRAGPDCQIEARLLMTSYWQSVAETMAEAALTDADCVASAVIMAEGSCELAVKAWTRLHYVTRADWNMPAVVVFCGEAEEVKPVKSNQLLHLVLVKSLTRGI